MHPGKPRVFQVRRPDEADGSVEVALIEGALQLSNRSQRTVRVNGSAVREATLYEGDVIEIGKDVFRVAVVPDELVIEDPGPTATAPSSDSDRQRRRRSLSASMPAYAPQSPPANGLLSKMSSVFHGRSERARLEALEAERRDVLVQIASAVLGDGLFAHGELSALCEGRSVTIDPAQVPPRMLERWRDWRDRVALLDAELKALRKRLGVRDQERPASEDSSRREVRSREARVFATLDRTGTEPLEGLAGPPLK